MTKPVYREVRRQITDRDNKILNFLWKWKLASNQAIAKKFFPEVQLASVSTRLRQLVEVGYLAEVMVEKRCYVYGLGKKGYEYIHLHFTVETHGGYRSEYPYHDYITTAFHLGEWLTHQPAEEEAEIYSEQQLRSVPDELWPEWIPRSPFHRPDGYSLMISESKTKIYAFEAEISLKSKAGYERAMYFYKTKNEIDNVFWLVSTEGLLRSIKNIFQKYDVQDDHKHCFLLKKDFLELGWDAKFVAGDLVGKCLNDILKHNGISRASQWHHARDVSALLDTRKTITLSTGYEKPPDHENSDRVYSNINIVKPTP